MQGANDEMEMWRGLESARYCLEETIGLRHSLPSEGMNNILSRFNKFFHINLSNRQKEANGFVICLFAQMGLFNSLHSTFTSYKAPKMKLDSYACHTAAKDL